QAAGPVVDAVALHGVVARDVERGEVLGAEQGGEFAGFVVGGVDGQVGVARVGQARAQHAGHVHHRLHLGPRRVGRAGGEVDGVAPQDHVAVGGGRGGG